MTKIDKTDINNINLIIKETDIKGVSKIRLKKNNYEIEITSESISQGNQISQVIDRPNEKNEKSESVEEIDKENIVKSPMVGVAYLSAEFLIGPQLNNNLLNLGIQKEAEEALKRFGIDSLSHILDVEEDFGISLDISSCPSLVSLAITSYSST